jgi:hypothetical protein
MCRMLYTLKEGAIVSKPAAARWAMNNAGAPWTALIERTLAGRELGAELADELRTLVRFTVASAESPAT